MVLCIGSVYTISVFGIGIPVHGSGETESFKKVSVVCHRYLGYILALYRIGQWVLNLAVPRVVFCY